MADSFRNESIGYHYELAIESIDSLNSFKHVESFSNQTQLCVARRHNSSAVALIGTSQYVLSLTRSLRLFKPHLTRHKYIINRRLH